jgi:CubicO group peptidase (beta-lactamase class C family)
MTNPKGRHSMTLLAHGRRTALLAAGLFFLASLIAAGQAPDKTPPSPAEVKLKDQLNAKLGFKAYVFDGEKFPACEFEQPAKAEELLGAYTIKAIFHDRELNAVESAKSPGFYGAVVEVTPKQGQALRRYFTLYRTGGKIDAASGVPAESLADFAKVIGIDEAIVKQEVMLIAAEWKKRTFQEFARDPRSARLFAGLAQTKAGGAAARKNEDAFALDRQWWVSFKRKRAGLDKLYAKPFVCPRPIEGKPAPELREGTAAEAGFKPDAAEKIDAVCKAWAEVDDQAFAVCIARHGVIVLHQAYGQRDGKPMTVTTKSWMASITKAMSASLMMMLVDQGLVGLDDPIDKHIPAVRGIKVDTPLTIRNLYTHTNGLEKWPSWHDELPDVEERLASYYPMLKVGKTWAYNGTGYIVGGKIIENISGEAVPLFFQRHLLTPLGCTNTDVVGTHADAFSVPLDIARFGQMLLNQGTYGKQRFFKEETFRKMLPQKLSEVLGPDAKDITRTFGIGLDGKPEQFGHGAASAATFHVNRTDDLVVIMTRNKMGKLQDKHNGKFWQAIRDGMDKAK